MAQMMAPQTSRKLSQPLSESSADPLDGPVQFPTKEPGKIRELYHRYHQDDFVTKFSNRARKKIQRVEARAIEDDEIVAYRPDHDHRKYVRKWFIPRMASLALSFKNVNAHGRDVYLQTCNGRWNIYLAAKISTPSPSPQDAKVLRIKAMKECLNQIRDHELYWNIRMMSMHARPQEFYGEQTLHNGLNNLLRKRDVLSDYDYNCIRADLKNLCLDGADLVTLPRLRLLKLTLQVLFPNREDWKGVFETEDTMIQCRKTRPLIMLFCNSAVDLERSGDDWPKMEQPMAKDITPIVKGTVLQFMEQLECIIPAVVSYERFPKKNLWNW